MSDLKLALLELSSSAETDLTGGGSYDSIAGTFALDAQSDSEFTALGSGCGITWGGDEAATVVADCSLTLAAASANSDLSLRWYVDGSAVGQPVHLQPANTNPHPVSVPQLLPVDAGKEIELKLANNTDDTNATAQTATMRLQVITHS